MSRPMSNPRLAAVALLLGWGLLAVDARSQAAAASTSVGESRRLGLASHPPRPAFLLARGGATVVDDEEDIEDEYDEYDEEEEEEEEELAAAARAKAKAKADRARAKAAVLSKSALEATRKAQAKKTSRAKEAVSATLSKPKKKKKGSVLKALHVPYLIRACLNPLTLIAMTRAYFASLFNISYLEEDSSQGLRSALEEKAKKSGGDAPGGKKKGKRAMKPGQAKTLSDLPQLSA